MLEACVSVPEDPSLRQAMMTPSLNAATEVEYCWSVV
jgi:hypothetical protein